MSWLRSVLLLPLVRRGGETVGAGMYVVPVDAQSLAGESEVQRPKGIRCAACLSGKITTGRTRCFVDL